MSCVYSKETDTHLTVDPTANTVRVTPYREVYPSVVEPICGRELSRGAVRVLGELNSPETMPWVIWNPSLSRIVRIHRVQMTFSNRNAIASNRIMIWELHKYREIRLVTATTIPPPVVGISNVKTSIFKTSLLAPQLVSMATDVNVAGVIAEGGWFDGGVSEDEGNLNVVIHKFVQGEIIPSAVDQSVSTQLSISFVRPLELAWREMFTFQSILSRTSWRFDGSAFFTEVAT